MSAEETSSLVSQVRARLAAEWRASLSRVEGVETLPAAVRTAIRESVNSKTKSYRYVLLTQLLPKLVRPELDCHVVQASAEAQGAFDARSICQHVVVPFDRENNNVLGGSPEPYANNPLRIPMLSPAARQAQKDKTGFDGLLEVLDYAQTHPGQVQALVHAVLDEIRDRLRETAVVYPLPNRVSLQAADDCIARFISQRSGGLRLQSVAVALFRTIGERFALFSEVSSHAVNASDSSTGSSADLECVDAEGRIVLAVEVKDRQLELRHVQDKLPGVRAKGIREFMFLIQDGASPEEAPAIQETVSRQFSSGQNLYIVEWSQFLTSCLVLLGEDGRRALLSQVSRELDVARADLSHRRRWAELLGAI